MFPEYHKAILYIISKNYAHNDTGISSDMADAYLRERMNIVRTVTEFIIYVNVNG